MEALLAERSDECTDHQNKRCGGSVVDDDVDHEQDINSWTDEKHLHFLRLMETSFVKSMFHKASKNNGGGSGRHWNCPQHGQQHGNKNHQQQENYRRCRLDRYVPDMSESTLDTKKPSAKRRKHDIDHSTTTTSSSSSSSSSSSLSSASSHSSSVVDQADGLDPRITSSRSSSPPSSTNTRQLMIMRRRRLVTANQFYRSTSPDQVVPHWENE